MPKLVLATRNSGKIAEIRQLLADTPWVAVSCDTFPGYPEPRETGQSFRENASIKAHAIAEFTGELSMADDSGLEVDTLKGAPGVYSARFSGPNATDASNNALLLQRLADHPISERNARFQCVICLATPDGRSWFASGNCEGHIGLVPAGSEGFGYDPLFVPDGFESSFGELGPAIKNQVSHRGKAVNAACAILNRIEL
ncbi:MAG: RdgB/HAM1 family non-canonical purine NTP pyrophosphatase [Candidatus Latescibacteria bacterium]|jgi:XTP/dITP diphosphohydrolase|nr:RdgB/HAM1 family non-canonical purine NTP pyrophosphatase [Candidatus Latescibacterota bacterium]